MMAAPTPSPIDRYSEHRAVDRFSIFLQRQYKTLNKRGAGEHGSGRIINISSSGVLFTTEHYRIPERRVELSINWPVKLNDKCKLKLVVRGPIVRCQEGMAALKIQHYEFRTHGLHICWPLEAM